MKTVSIVLAGTAVFLLAGSAAPAEYWHVPYGAPCTERENVFAFTEKPSVRMVGKDRYEIAFAVKGNCDVAAGLIDEKGAVVRHLGAGVLGRNAPSPFQKDSLKQTLVWDGKDDLGEYVKQPDELRVRVRLGLKPVLDRRLGVTNPKSIPGGVWGLCADETGVYVIAGVDGIRGVRKFDRAGNYVRTLFPPPAGTPPEKLEGLDFVEYEPGRRALQTPDLTSVCNDPPAGCLPKVSTRQPISCRPAIANGRVYYLAVPDRDRRPPRLHYVGADGSTDMKGTVGRDLGMPVMSRPNLAASPDGKWLYLAGDDESTSYTESMACAVFRCSLAGDGPTEVFAGVLGKPGSDDRHLNRAQGIDCDGQGRVYVCDNLNSRIQVFSPEGKLLKSIRIDKPVDIAVNRKTGAMYVLHVTRVRGRSENRLSKLVSFDDPTVAAHAAPPAGLMTLDWWSPRPRVWLAGRVGGREGGGIMDGRFSISGANVTVWEDDGKGFRKIADFEEEVTKEAGTARIGSWPGTTRAGAGKVVCDPVRERAYFMNSWVFDLRSGERLADLRLPGVIDDIAFDKRGYMHCHFNPGFYQRGVGRLDPGTVQRDGTLRECPYDYGVEARGWVGVLSVRDQPGSKFFQDGIGVNMRGEVAENSNIYYVPKRDDAAVGFFRMMSDNSGSPKTYAGFQRVVQAMQKRGEEVYSIRPRPGVPLAGATIWTFETSGELRDTCAVTAGGLINGVMMDEDGGLYFVNNRTRLAGGTPFLAGRGGVFGAGQDAKPKDPFTGTLMKVPQTATILSSSASVKMDTPPARDPELGQYHEKAWCEGAAWLYAGASPIVPGGCSCPTQRLHTDWYKRTFVPEVYRHSIGVVDTAGNLILHIGEYGNFDSGDEIATSDARMISGTDNYLCFSDRGERLVSLKFDYHAEETVPIRVR